MKNIIIRTILSLLLIIAGAITHELDIHKQLKATGKCTSACWISDIILEVTIDENLRY